MLICKYWGCVSLWIQQSSFACTPSLCPNLHLREIKKSVPMCVYLVVMMVQQPEALYEFHQSNRDGKSCGEGLHWCSLLIGEGVHDIQQQVNHLGQQVKAHTRSGLNLVHHRESWRFSITIRTSLLRLRLPDYKIKDLTLNIMNKIKHK